MHPKTLRGASSRRGVFSRRSVFSRRGVLVGLAALTFGSAAGLGVLSQHPNPAQASAAVPAQKVIEAMVTDALAILRDPALKKSRSERQKRLRVVADRVFAWEAMAKSSLGHYWRDLKQEDRDEFVRIFKDLLANQYMDDIDRFQGNEQISVHGATKQGELVVVKTSLKTASAEQVPMDYTLHDSAGKWMIEDVSIEGVSMVKHYRSSFQRFLVNKSFAELLDVLRRKLG